MSEPTATFQHVLDSIEPGAERPEIAIPAGWVQGRAAFGGLVAAAGLRAMRGMVPSERTPRALQITFAGPVAPGRAEVRTRRLREGKSASVLESHIVQGDSVCTVVAGSFGADRPSEISVPAPGRPEVKGPGEVMELPYLPGVTPVFTQNFVYRYALGDFPFTGSGSGVMGGWCRFRNEDRIATAEDILGLVDAWPPAVLPMLKLPAPGSSLTWTVSFLPLPPGGRTGDWWFYRAETDAADHGYAHTRAMLWDPSGRPAAVSSQTVAVFG